MKVLLLVDPHNPDTATLSGVDKYFRELVLSMDESVEYVVAESGEQRAEGRGYLNRKETKVTKGEQRESEEPRAKNQERRTKNEERTCRSTLSPFLPLWFRIFLGYLKDIRVLAKRLKPYRNQVDLLHVVAGGCEISPIAAKLAGFPCVLDTVQAMHSEDEAGQHWIRKLIERLCFCCGDYHIFVSDATHEAWKRRIGFSDTQSTTIFNGMAPPDYSGFDRTAYRKQFCPDPENTIILGICARLHHMKGHLLLLEAFAKVLHVKGKCLTEDNEGNEETGDGEGNYSPTSNIQHSTSNVQLGKKLLLLIAGEGPERQNIEEKIEELGIGEYVKLLGHRTDPCEFTASLDLHVMPSLCIETIGYANIEAMFAGVPCIVSDTGGMKEIVGGSDGGAVVPAGDVEALADAMGWFVNDEQLRAEAGERGRTFAHEKLTAKVMVERTFDIYQYLVGILNRRERR